MSKSSKNLLFENKDLNILKVSQLPKDEELYGNFFDVIKDKDELSKQDYEKLDNKARIILTNKYDFLQRCKSEWKFFDHDYSDKTKPCTLCHRATKEIYFIKNSFNGNVINVGSTCIDQFEGSEAYEQIRKYKNQRERDKRIIEFKELEIDDLDFIKNAMDNFHNIDIQLPLALLNKIKYILDTLVNVKSGYINKGGKFNAVSSKFMSLKLDYLTLWRQATDFYNTNKDKKLICDRETANWLHDYDVILWETVASNDGCFTNETLKHITCEHYVNKHINEFRSCLADPNIKILNASGGIIIFNYKPKLNSNPISFTVDAAYFMKYIGANCLTEPNYRFDKNSLKDISIDNNFLNFNSIRDHIINKLDFDIENDDDTKYLYVKGKPNNKKVKGVMYLRISSAFFFKNCNNFLLDEDKKLYDVWNKWYNSRRMSDKWITKEERFAIKEASKSASLQRQKDYY